MIMPRPAPRRRVRGFTLVETLVALVVVSIGLLGIAVLQLSSLRSSQGSSLRSQATFLAYDIADRMRSNRSTALANNGAAYTINIGSGVPAAGATIESIDLNAWKQNLANTLPLGDGAIAFDPATRLFTVTIQWDDSHASDPADAAAAARQFVTQVQI